MYQVVLMIYYLCWVESLRVNHTFKYRYYYHHSQWKCVGFSNFLLNPKNKNHFCNIFVLQHSISLHVLICCNHWQLNDLNWPRHKSGKHLSYDKLTAVCRGRRFMELTGEIRLLWKKWQVVRHSWTKASKKYLERALSLEAICFRI